MYFAAMQRDPGRFIFRQPRVVRWLRDLRYLRFFLVGFLYAASHDVGLVLEIFLIRMQ